jgi:predicted deacylase
MIDRRELTVADGTADGVRIPYFDIRGSRPGPQLTVIAGVHGAEYTSIAAARRFVTELDEESVSGRITVVPVTNPSAFWARTPFVVPQDGKNLNRCFPGRPDGSAAEAIAAAVFAQIVAGSDFLVDLHAGDIPESLEPFTIYDVSSVAAAARDLAVAYGFAHCVRQAATGRTVAGSSCAAAADAGIPAIIAECGGNGILDPSAVVRHLGGLRNLAMTVGVLAGEPTRGQPIEEHDGWEWLRTDTGGWWQPAVRVGSTVAAGAHLGVVSDVWTDQPIAEITAPTAGTVLFLTASPAVTADGLLMGLARPAPATGGGRQ